MAYERRDFAGAAPATTLNGGIGSGDASITVTSGTGWPTGSQGDFFVVIDRGLPSEEKIRCASRTGNTIAVQTSGRGADDTSAAAHSNGATIEHVLVSLDADEANYTVAETVGKVTAAGQLLVADGANSLTPLNNGTQGLPLVAGASTPAYGTLGSSALAADSVGSSQIQANAVGAGEIAADAVTTAKILDSNVTTAKINNLAVTEGKIATDAVTTAKIADGDVTTAKLDDAAVTAAKLAAAVAGAGLTGGAGTALAVSVDDATIAIDTDTLEVKDAGIGSTQLAAGLGRGVLDYAEVTSNQGSITSSTVDLTSLTLTVTVRSGARIRITGCITVTTDVNGDTADFKVRESSTQLKRTSSTLPTAALGETLTVTAIETPSAGSHTYKLSLARSQGSGTLTMVASSTDPAWIMVEDIGD